MTDADLKALILADSAAKALADAGDDGGCAARVAQIAPSVPRETRHTYLSLAGSTVGPEAASRLILAVRAAVAAGNLLLDEVQWSLRNPPGVDVGHPATHATLDVLAASEFTNGLTQADADAIKALGNHPDAISATDVSRVWAEFRPGGKIA